MQTHGAATPKARRPMRAGHFVAWHHQFILADRSQVSLRSYICWAAFAGHWLGKCPTSLDVDKKTFAVRRCHCNPAWMRASRQLGLITKNSSGRLRRDALPPAEETRRPSLRLESLSNNNNKNNNNRT